MANRTVQILVMGSMLVSGLLGQVESAVGAPVTGRRLLPDYEADVYGPLPFSEEVTGFLVHELDYILRRQNKDGSWDSAQPAGNGRTTMQAGGTVDNTTLTSMCAYSLRQYPEFAHEAINDSIARAVHFVTYMIHSGKLRTNVQDAPWRYVYALRFLLHEYPNVNDPTLRKGMEDACAIIVEELKDMQFGTQGQKSIPFRWERRSNPGLIVDDTGGETGVVLRCAKDTPAYAAGMRSGDRLLTANGVPVDTAVRYAMSELSWTSGETVEFKVLRMKKTMIFRVKLPGQFPGTLGLRVRVAQGGVFVEGFEYLSNRNLATLQLGDRVMKIDDRTIATTSNLDGLSLYAGQKVVLQVLRGETTHRFDYVCAPVPVADLGVRVSNRLDQSTKDGLAIEQLTAGSCLNASGLRPGDRLIRIDGSLILNQRHFQELVRSTWGGKNVRVMYLSGDERREAEVTAGSISHQQWLKGYHGLRIRQNGTARVETVDFGSPAAEAGCEVGDQVLAVDSRPVGSGREALAALSGIPGGKRVVLDVRRDDDTKRQRVEFFMNLPTDSVWVSKDRDAAGGWGYLTRVRGSNTFVASDTLRELLKARKVMPGLEIPEEMLYRPFLMLSKLRKKQPNSDVESYRYDAAGSFWSVKDIRGDIGRLCSAELACLMYSDNGAKRGEYGRTQKHLEETLSEWLKHRGILDLVKFPKDHADYSLAPWCWMYSYRTTLEAADYLTTNDELREEVRRISLKAFFKHMEFRYEEKLGEEGWIIGGDLDKELHDSCQLLDGLSTMKHLYRPRVEVTSKVLREAMNLFHESRYGDAYRIIRKALEEGASGRSKLATDSQLVLGAIEDRFDARLSDVKAIHKANPFDGIYHLESMKQHFQGYPGLKKVEALAAEWKQRLPKVSPEARRRQVVMNMLGGQSSGQESEVELLTGILAFRETDPLPAKWNEATDLLQRLDPSRDLIRGRWGKVDEQLVSFKEPYARLQLHSVPRGSYEFEAQFTRVRGDCMAVILPVGETSVLLVVSGWAGKVSGLAFVGGRDADRNKTTRDGKLSNREKHTLAAKVLLIDNGQAVISISLDGKPYLDWQGPRSDLKPDRHWGMKKPGSLGIGAYDAVIVFHSCQVRMLDNTEQ